MTHGVPSLDPADPAPSPAAYPPPGRPNPVVRRHPDAATLAADVATALLEVVADAQAEGRVPEVVLTGGTIADEIHREVSRLADSAGVDWGAVVFWFGDERFVAADSDDRNAGQVRSALLDAVGARRVHEVPAAGSGCASVEDAARAYASELDRRGPAAFDVVMLGVGPDGHVASLFPGLPGLRAEGSAVAVHDSPKPPAERVSLTYATLNQATRVWMLVSGEGKAEAVGRALRGQTGGPDGAPASVEDTPAVGVRGTSETVWWLDDAAASHLPR